MDEIIPLNLGIRTQWEINRGGNYVENRRVSFRNDLLAITIQLHHSDESKKGYRNGGRVQS